MMKKMLKPIFDYYLYLRRYRNIQKLHHLISDDVSILSMNCFGGRIYQDLHREYLSPTAGLFFYMDDFNLLLKDIHLLERDIIPCPVSKWRRTNEIISQHGGRQYPIGVFEGTDIEIHFLHYPSFEIAVKKWKRRVERFNYKKFLVIAFQQNECSKDAIHEFANLDFPNKIFFSNELLDEIDLIHVKEFTGKFESPDPYRYSHIYYNYLVKKLEIKPII